MTKKLFSEDVSVVHGTSEVLVESDMDDVNKIVIVPMNDCTVEMVWSPDHKRVVSIVLHGRDDVIIFDEERKNVLSARTFYYLKVLPHKDKDGVEGTQEKAKQMMNALKNLGVSVYLKSEFIDKD